MLVQCGESYLIGGRRDAQKETDIIKMGEAERSVEISWFYVMKTGGAKKYSSLFFFLSMVEIQYNIHLSFAMPAFRAGFMYVSLRVYIQTGTQLVTTSACFEYAPAPEGVMQFSLVVRPTSQSLGRCIGVLLDFLGLWLSWSRRREWLGRSSCFMQRFTNSAISIRPFMAIARGLAVSLALFPGRSLNFEIDSSFHRAIA